MIHRVVRIELFGVPRMKADRSEVTVDADTIGKALCALVEACPSLSPSVVDQGILSPAYLVALNGKHFTSDVGAALADGDVLVIVSAHAGG
jgi:molybdopterin converting factor small subunit